MRSIEQSPLKHRVEPRNDVRMSGRSPVQFIIESTPDGVSLLRRKILAWSGMRRYEIKDKLFDLHAARPGDGTNVSQQVVVQLNGDRAHAAILTQPSQGENLPHTPLEAHLKQLLRFHRKLHRQLLQNISHEPVHQQRHSRLFADPALARIEQLVF